MEICEGLEAAAGLLAFSANDLDADGFGSHALFGVGEVRCHGQTLLADLGWKFGLFFRAQRLEDSGFPGSVPTLQVTNLSSEVEGFLGDDLFGFFHHGG